MDTTGRKSLEHYLSLDYSFHAIADEEGGWTIIFPDLPGCLTMVDTIEELPQMVDEVRRLWIETEYEDGADIPLPSYPEEYSGKFNVRLPRSLHHRLVDSAERDGVSLNQYVVGLLSQGDALARMECRLNELEAKLAAQPAKVEVAA